jgi:predicted transcriptional regulator
MTLRVNEQAVLAGTEVSTDKLANEGRKISLSPTMIRARKVQMYLLMHNGYSAKDVANMLGISERAVNKHVHDVRSQLDNFDIAATRKAFMTLMPHAFKSVKHHLRNKSEKTTIAYLQGQGVFESANKNSQPVVNVNIANIKAVMGINQEHYDQDAIAKAMANSTVAPVEVIDDDK